jgi:hypothetical protein
MIGIDEGIKIKYDPDQPETIPDKGLSLWVIILIAIIISIILVIGIWYAVHYLYIDNPLFLENM